MASDPEIRDLLQEVNRAHEDVKKDALDHLFQDRADALARPKKERVEIPKALMKTRLKELPRRCGGTSGAFGVGALRGAGKRRRCPQEAPAALGRVVERRSFSKGIVQPGPARIPA